MTTLREAATAALKFLEDGDFVYPTELADNLKAALAEPTPLEDVFTHGSAWSKDGKRIDPMSVYAEPVQEPVAWRFHDGKMWCYVNHLTDLSASPKFEPLYTSPPQRKPLTDDEIKKLLIEHAGMTVVFSEVDLRFARAIERAHGIGVNK